MELIERRYHSEDKRLYLIYLLCVGTYLSSSSGQSGVERESSGNVGEVSVLSRRWEALEC